jgi:hypothetical protein
MIKEAFSERKELSFRRSKTPAFKDRETRGAGKK